MILFGCKDKRLFLTKLITVRIGVFMLKVKVKTGGQVILIPTCDVLPPENYMREYSDPDSIRLLADSIRTNGMLYPVTVRSSDNGKYIIISGERRRQAACQAGLEFIPCLLVAADGFQSLVYELIANLHSASTHFLECSAAVDKLHGMLSVGELSELLSIPEGQILSRIKLLSLPEHIKAQIISSGMSESLANSLCTIKDEKRLNKVCELVVDGCGFNEAMALTEEKEEKKVISVHYKDLKVFENTIEHAVNSMTVSGIVAFSQKQESDTEIMYTVRVSKMI